MERQINLIVRPVEDEWISTDLERETEGIRTTLAIGSFSHSSKLNDLLLKQRQTGGGRGGRITGATDPETDPVSDELTEVFNELLDRPSFQKIRDNLLKEIAKGATTLNIQVNGDPSLLRYPWRRWNLLQKHGRHLTIIHSYGV